MIGYVDRFAFTVAGEANKGLKRAVGGDLVDGLPFAGGAHPLFVAVSVAVLHVHGKVLQKKKLRIGMATRHISCTLVLS